MGSSPPVSLSPWTAITKYHSLGDLTTNTYLSEFWRLEIPADWVTGEGRSWFVDGYLPLCPPGPFPATCT